ncbi:uncharacterized protein LOC143462115 [Clavelina lepadiformis]|uniref:uncharacterized protein LOC143462115 n=1 Tax=Clavelina lepadiformis TaxID=159417 RepID=UPI004041CCA0
MTLNLQNPSNLVKFVTGLHEKVPRLVDIETSAGDVSFGTPKITSSSLIVKDDNQAKPKEKLTCSSCKQIFFTKSSLKSHSKSHRKIKPYRCDICGRFLFSKQALKVHMITHGDVYNRPFTCQHCGKNFQTKQNLKNHTNIHLDIKPFACSKCEKSFCEKSSLTKHLFTHSKEKSYSCNFCDQKFSQVSSQQRHMNKFHSDVPQFGGFLPTLGAEIVACELMMLESTPGSSAKSC